ncbi:D-alanine--D-alanine ligase [Sulfurimonas sp. HSL-1716]|uniref:D-alanine--D-alanine ligase n=1 Tax=Hydrocurvibacter sulfurireducens TaxID=3131937 RepID=UPI0031F7FADA
MKLAILFGGASFEHEISIVSAVTVKEKLVGFELEFIFCDQDHTFYLIEPSRMKAVTFSKGEYKKMPSLTLENGGFVKKSLFSKELVGTKVLNLVHGADGEDGVIASLLDFYSIPFIGPRTSACVFSFDKRYTKYLCDALGVKSVAYRTLSKNDERKVDIAYPFIIKPARLGSSIGVSVVKEEKELDYALDVAFEFDENVIIEPFITGVKEYNLAGCMVEGKIKFSIVEEPQKNEFLDFEKKYMDFSRSATVSSAEIDDKLVAELQSTFAKIYTNLFEGALIRCDFFVIEDEIYLNEINPIPGSMANYLFDDFSTTIGRLLNSLPQANRAKVSYQYIHSISSAKGK